MVWKFCVLRCGSAQLALAVVALIAIASLQVAAAATSSLTESEQLYRQTRKSSDRSTQLLGERWYGLVRRQEWTDASGKFTTTARYLEHDADLKWVKLRVERTMDGRREAKDVTVPIERLSKTCQSRVRQIAHLEPKVREAALAAAQEAQAETEEQQSEQPGDQPALDEMGVGDGGWRAPRLGEVRRRIAPRASRMRDVPSGPAPPESWPSSYEAFRANFTVQGRGGQQQVDWGTLRTLQQVHDALQNADGSSSVPGPLAAAGLAAQLASVGEFTWEAELLAPPADDLEWADRLDLAPLPEPLSLQLVLDQDSGNWQRFRVGQRVRLTGRFIAFAGRYKIVAAIRFPESSPARRASRPAAR